MSERTFSLEDATSCAKLAARIPIGPAVEVDNLTIRRPNKVDRLGVSFIFTLHPLPVLSPLPLPLQGPESEYK
jgi:hypothetical protein